LSTGKVVTYDRLLLALGASAVPLEIPGADAEGVVKLDNLEDSRHILGMARRGKTAVVIGGGITALELAEGLAARHVKVHYLLRGDRYWSNVLDETESRIIEGRLKDEGVTIHYRTEAARILKRGKHVNGIQITSGKSIRCNLVAVAVGIRPRLELARQAGLQTDRGVLVDEYMQTSQPDIFAAGDVAQVFDPVSGRAVLDSLWGPAREQGYAAGLNMAGQATAYRKPVPYNVTKLAGLTTTIIGHIGSGRNDDLVSIVRGESEAWQELPNTIVTDEHLDVNRLRLMVGEHTLVGALVMGNQTLSRPLQELVTAGADISSIRDHLLTRDGIGQTIIDFWKNWRPV
jgi:NAD(P)H-nitrite reductase large subunit